MSGGYDCMQLTKQDAVMMLSASVHLGSRNLNFQMEQYVYKRNSNGHHIINLRKTWEKLLLAARAIAAVKNPAEICAVSAHKNGQRAVLKFARATGTTPIAGRFTPGTFTNQIQAAFKEPGLLVINDPRTDHQPVGEAAYANIPVIAFVNTDTPMRYVDIGIPCNNNSSHAIGLMWWMLAREVLRIRGTIRRDQPWDVMVDLYFSRETEEHIQTGPGQGQPQRDAERLEQAKAPAAVSQEMSGENWGGPMAAIGRVEPAGASLQWTENVPPTKEETSADWGASATDWNPTANPTEW